MANTCTYHPTQPAPYQCSKCETYYCSGCVSKRSGSYRGHAKTYYFCPKCNIPVEMLAVGTFIKPFWNRLPSFFAYPLQLWPLVLIFAVAAIETVTGGRGIISLALEVISIKYALTVLKRTVNGNLEAPELSYQVLAEDIGPALKQMALFFLVGLAVVLVLLEFGWVAGTIAMLLALLLLPVMIIILATSESLLNALNPAHSMMIVWRIGRGYLLMYLFLTLLFFAPIAFIVLFSGHLPRPVENFLTTAAFQYYTLVSYSLMGYMILQYHQEIGYEVEAEDYREQGQVLESGGGSRQEQSSTDAFLSQVAVLVKEGRLDDAVFLMQDRVRGKKPDLPLAERYYNLLKITQRTAELQAHAIVYLDLLADENDRTTACEIYRECVARDPQFRPNPDALFKIGMWILSSDAKTGVMTLYGFVKAHPAHALAPKAVFTLGKALYEQFNDSTNAQKMFNGLLSRYPDHDLAPHAKEYLARINGGTAGGPG
jgi:hypothetical protein